METVALVFPHQLYRDHPALHPGHRVFLVEEWLFFNQFQFHKQKLVLHRASMKCYEDYLSSKGFQVEYIEATDPQCDVRKLVKTLAEEGVTSIRYCDPTDDWLGRRLRKAAAASSIGEVTFRNPNFLNTIADVEDFFDRKGTYFQTDFYIWQRKQRQILIEGNNQPVGGKWSFDSDNRKRLPKNEAVPLVSFPEPNKWVEEARNYVEANWPSNFGDTTDFNTPVTFAEADNWLTEFLQRRLEKFGVYEDAMVAAQSILFHSRLTPMLNTGLLNPLQVIERTLDHAATHEIPLNSLEGFIRQVMGWREFIRIVYEREGRTQRTKNYWGFTRRIPKAFWEGTTGIAPVDLVIRKALTNGYNYHIERLMIMGNFMILCEFKPDDVYRWFMEMYIDAYDWVMVPNVYGMTQFADGGLMTTKPYISGSNYLMKMGDWPKGDWQQTWDGLFWRFMHEHRDFFLQNPRLGMLVNTFDKMSPEKKKVHLENAEAFLAKLDQMVTY